MLETAEIIHHGNPQWPPFQMANRLEEVQVEQAREEDN